MPVEAGRLRHHPRPGEPGAGGFGAGRLHPGWHAIEYLLWGKDTNAKGPGARPHTDYVAGRGMNDRRRDYLRLASRSSGERPVDPGRRLGRRAARTSLSSLEVYGSPQRGGPRLPRHGRAGWLRAAGKAHRCRPRQRRAETDHSPYSDNTTGELINGLLGIRNVYFGAVSKAGNSRLQQAPRAPQFRSRQSGGRGARAGRARGYGNSRSLRSCSRLAQGQSGPRQGGGSCRRLARSRYCAAHGRQSARRPRDCPRIVTSHFNLPSGEPNDFPSPAHRRRVCLCIGCKLCTSKGPDGMFLEGCPWDAIEMMDSVEWEKRTGYTLNP